MNFPGLFLRFAIILVCLGLILLPGCSNQEEKQQPKLSGPEPVGGGIYRTPLPNNPATLDPALVQDQYGEAVIHQLFDGLVRFDSYLSILPGLAETWQVREQGRLYRFVIRKNARFHNLDPVTSADIVFSLTRLLRADPAPAVLPHLLKIVGAREYRAGLRQEVSGLEIENDKIVQIRLEQSHVPFLTALGMYQAAIIPKKEVLGREAEFGMHPVGSGPFRFVDWNTDQSLVLKRFENYYKGPAFLDEIHYKIYSKKQDSEALTDFQQGNIEDMEVYGDVKEKLASKKGLQWFHRPSLSLFFYGMNLKHPNLKHPDLRKALSLAIDRTAFVSQVYKGQFEIARTILPPGMPGYNPLNQIADNDPEQAGQHLDLVGSDLPVLEIVSAFKTPRVEQEMEMIKKFWAGIGIGVKIKYITDWKNFEAYLRSDSVQIYRYAWFADMPDPDSFLYSLFASDSPTNFMHFKSEKVDTMLLTARGIVDPVERAKMYQGIESLVLEASPLIPLFYMSVDRVYQPYVKSVKVSALGAHTMALDQIWLDKSDQDD